MDDFLRALSLVSPVQHLTNDSNTSPFPHRPSLALFASQRSQVGPLINSQELDAAVHFQTFFSAEHLMPVPQVQTGHVETHLTYASGADWTPLSYTYLTRHT